MARPLRLAHRGDARTSIENTLQALRAASALPGVDGVELDVRVAGDGTPVLSHDVDLWRTHRDRRHVADLSASELAAVGVPALEAALEVLPRDVFVDVELKEDTGRAALQSIAAARPDGYVAISSFRPDALERAASTQPHYPRWLNAVALTQAVMATARELRCAAVALHWRAVTPAALAAAGRRGLRVVAWTVRTRHTRERLEQLGVHATCIEGAALE